MICIAYQFLYKPIDFILKRTNIDIIKYEHHVPGKTLKGQKWRCLYMKKYYTLETIDSGRTVKFNKKFSSRNQAINYAFAYFEKHLFNDSLQIEDEFNIDNDKHNVEYVIGYNNRFRINRVQLAF